MPRGRGDRGQCQSRRRANEIPPVVLAEPIDIEPNRISALRRLDDLGHPLHRGDCLARDRVGGHLSKAVQA